MQEAERHSSTVADSVSSAFPNKFSHTRNPPNRAVAATNSNRGPRPDPVFVPPAPSFVHASYASFLAAASFFSFSAMLFSRRSAHLNTGQEPGAGLAPWRSMAWSNARVFSASLALGRCLTPNSRSSLADVRLADSCSALRSDGSLLVRTEVASVVAGWFGMLDGASWEHLAWGLVCWRLVVVRACGRCCAMRWVVWFEVAFCGCASIGDIFESRDERVEVLERFYLSINSRSGCACCVTSQPDTHAPFDWSLPSNMHRHRVLIERDEATVEIPTVLHVQSL
jgi:hypothetical protein